MLFTVFGCRVRNAERKPRFFAEVIEQRGQDHAFGKIDSFCVKVFAEFVGGDDPLGPQDLFIDAFPGIPYRPGRSLCNSRRRRASGPIR